MRTVLAAAIVVAAAALAFIAIQDTGEYGPEIAAALAIFIAVLAMVLSISRPAGPAEDRSRAAAELLETAGEACLLADRQGRILWQGEAWQAIAGQAKTLIGALDGLANGDPAQRESLAALAEHAAGGRSEIVEILRSGATPDQDRWFAVSSQILPGEQGAVLWRIRDVAMKGTEDLHNALKRLELVIDHSPIGAIEIDGDGRFYYVNRTVASWIGLGASEIVGRALRIGDYLAEGDAASAGLWSLRRRDDRLLKVFVTEIGRLGDRRRLILVDHSMELAWENALAKAEERYRRLVELAPVGIVTLDRKGDLVEANVAFCDLVGMTEATLARTSFVERVVRDARAAAQEWIQRGEKGERPKPLDVGLTGRVERPVQLWSGSKGDGAAPGEHLVVYVIDMSDRRNLEQQFAHAQKMQGIGQMAGGIAHDFNNLLTAMIGHCDLLLLRHHAGDPSFADILQVKQNANRAASLVRQLLAFSRRQTLRPKVVDIGEIMSELANLLRRLIGQTVKLELLAARDLGMVMVDPGQLEQVVVNLAVNARDAMPKGGRLSIRLSRHVLAVAERLSHETLPAGDYLRIDLEDTGEGIPPENMDKIFEPFFTTKAVGAGTGLGLSTVYGIVKQTGGFVAVKSAPGEGTVFSIFLPRISPDAKDAQAGGAEAAGRASVAEDLTGSASVLLVEDEFAVRSFAARALRNKGYKVIEAEDGQAALASIEKLKEPIDLLITDVLMPNVDGPTLIRKARKLRPDLKVIVISGYAEDAFRQELGADGNLGFLPKPFSLKDLAARVKETLGE